MCTTPPVNFSNVSVRAQCWQGHEATTMAKVMPQSQAWRIPVKRPNLRIPRSPAALLPVTTNELIC